MGVLVNTGAMGTAREGRCISAREDGPVRCVWGVGVGEGTMGQGAGAGRVLVSAGTWAELAPCCFGSVKYSSSWDGDTLFSIVFVHGDLTQFNFSS